MPKGLNPEQIWGPRGRGFQMVTLAPPGQLVYLTGQVAWDKDENIVGPGDVARQTQQCFENIRLGLAAIGGRMEDIVNLTTYYTAPDQLADIQKVRLEYLHAEQAPASTSVMVAGLGHPEFLVELTPIAVIPEDRFTGN